MGGNGCLAVLFTAKVKKQNVVGSYKNNGVLFEILGTNIGNNWFCVSIRIPQISLRRTDYSSNPNVVNGRSMYSSRRHRFSCYIVLHNTESK